MIISFRKKFLFLAIPKTASQTIRVALRPHLAPNDWEQCTLFEKRYFPVKKLADLGHGHISCRQIRPYLLPGMWEGFFKTCIVRNPYDRFVSLCFFRYPELMKNAADCCDEMKQILEAQKKSNHLLFLPQKEYLVDADGHAAVDFIGRYERLEEDIINICKRADLPRPKLSVTNASAHGPYQEYYDAELTEMVRDAYAADFSFFNYSTNIPNASG